MPPVLHERLGVFGADVLATLARVAAHRLHVFVHPVVGPQPLALAGVAGEHLRLTVVGGADVDERGGLGGGAVGDGGVFEGVAVVEVGDDGAGRAGHVGDVGDAVGERGGAGQERDHLVV